MSEATIKKEQFKQQVFQIKVEDGHLKEWIFLVIGDSIEQAANKLSIRIKENLTDMSGPYRMTTYSIPVVDIAQYVSLLKEDVALHDLLYDNERPIITDTQYDVLYAELVELENKYPQFKSSDSPTQTIVGESTGMFEKVRHEIPMLSLDKTITEEGLRKFIAQRPGEPILVQRKEDGLTVNNTFYSTLKESALRGNGVEGDRIIHATSQIANIPQKIDFTDKLNLRMEVILPYEDFYRINVDGTYANTRNLAAGTLRSLDGSLAKERGLKAYVIEVGEIEGKEFTYDSERLEFVKSLGFEVSDTEIFFKEYEDIEAETQRFLSYVQSYDQVHRPNLPHAIDGLVIKFDKLSIREELGYTSKHPKWAIAYKFDSLNATTVLRDILVQVGKSGQVSPVGEYEKVEISGSNFTRATLHNFGNIRNKDIRIGDTILVEKAKDVIPQVVKSFHELRKGNEMEFVVPSHCPECGTPLEYDGENLFCKNTYCEPQVIGRLEHFVSRNAMNIDGIGEKTVELFYQQGLIKTFADFYDLQKHKSLILSLEKFDTKSYNNLIEGIEASKNRPFENVLYSLSIKHIGQTASKDFGKHYPSMDAFLDAAVNNNLVKIPGIGEKMIAELMKWLSNPENIQLIRTLQEKGLTMLSSRANTAEVTNTTSVIAGKKFVITGKLSKNRDAFKDEIEALGGKVVGSISKNTDYLLMGPDATGTTKHENAVNLGVPILLEEDYNKLIK